VLLQLLQPDSTTQTKHHTVKRYAPTNGSLNGAYQWCSYLANASEEVLVASLLFWPSVGSTSSIEFPISIL